MHFTVPGGKFGMRHNSITVKSFYNHCKSSALNTRQWWILSQWIVKVPQLCLTLRPHGLYCPWNSSGQNTRVGSLSLLQGIFPTQQLIPGLPHCRWILYQLIHKGNPRILEWVAYPFSRVSSWTRNQTGLLHCRWILYQQSCQRSSKKKENDRQKEKPTCSHLGDWF